MLVCKSKTSSRIFRSVLSGRIGYELAVEHVGLLLCPTKDDNVTTIWQEGASSRFRVDKLLVFNRNVNPLCLVKRVGIKTSKVNILNGM